jgi:hypothetical protein
MPSASAAPSITPTISLPPSDSAAPIPVSSPSPTRFFNFDDWFEAATPTSRPVPTVSPTKFFNFDDWFEAERQTSPVPTVSPTEFFNFDDWFEGETATTQAPSTTTATTSGPSSAPTKSPTEKPTEIPTKKATEQPLAESPAEKPTPSPTKKPTPSPTKKPPQSPTKKLAQSPSVTATTQAPSSTSTTITTSGPSNAPTKSATEKPTEIPSKKATEQPLTESPTEKPTPSPTKKPTQSPTKKPTQSPTKTLSQSALVNFGETPPANRLPLGICQGNCENHWDCAKGLYCLRREPFEEVPGCVNGKLDATATSYCVEVDPGKLVDYGGTPPLTHSSLGECQGDCDNDSDCEEDLICLQRTKNEAVPGCWFGDQDGSETDYCIVATATEPLHFLPTPPPGHPVNGLPFGICEGGCDHHWDCAKGLHCSRRGPFEEVPGCVNGKLDATATSYCVEVDPGKLVDYGGTPPLTHSSLGECQGDCDNDSDCEEGLICLQRTKNEAVPGCWFGDQDGSETDYCIVATATEPLHFLPTPPPGHPVNGLPLGICEGGCDHHWDCAKGLYCSRRGPFEEVPGCVNEKLDATATSYCVEVDPGKLVNYGGTPPLTHSSLGECQGDCDNDSDCEEGLICFQRAKNWKVPGCWFGDQDGSDTDYCIAATPTDPPYFLPTPPPGVVTYRPGNLTTFKDNLLLSEGLDAKLIAIAGEAVDYKDGKPSNIPFHGRPDAGATFPDTRSGNLEGWVYVSNSEIQEEGAGGVGAITFDKDGNIIDYRMILEGSTWNCGGGKTPWNTWVSCEESPADMKEGRIYQVDPFGEKSAQEMTLGSDGGTWESFAYDIRNPQQPHFYATEDHAKGGLARFTPSNPDLDQQWDILHGPGATEYLVLHPTLDGGSGTFSWTSNRDDAKDNASLYYRNSEGIDVYENQLFFVCKHFQMLFMLNLDDGTYTRSSTEFGLFDGGPDQLKRIMEDDDALLYFTEEGGVDAGIHARDNHGRFYTVLESPNLPGETTGLAFSPDAKYMYMAYQDVGMLYAIWRRDGLPFDEMHLDVKYHQAT